MATRSSVWPGSATSPSGGPCKPRLVQPRRLPDGLIDVRRQGQAETIPFVLEVATYPRRGSPSRLSTTWHWSSSIAESCRRCSSWFSIPRNQQVAESAHLQSAYGWARLQSAWKVVELWTVPAEELLAAGDVGMIPWVPLAHWDGPPEPIFRQCRARIDQDALPGERENLLAVSQVLAGLRYDDPRLFQILGGREAMIESLVLQQLKAQWTQEGGPATACEPIEKHIIILLIARFGDEARDLRAKLEMIDDEAQLSELATLAAVCHRPRPLFVIGSKPESTKSWKACSPSPPITPARK